MTETSNARPGASPSPDVLTSRDGPMGVATSLPPKRSLWPKKHTSYPGLEIAVRVRVSFGVSVGIRVRFRLVLVLGLGLCPGVVSGPRSCCTL